MLKSRKCWSRRSAIYWSRWIPEEKGQNKKCAAALSPANCIWKSYLAQRTRTEMCGECHKDVNNHFATAIQAEIRTRWFRIVQISRDWKARPGKALLLSCSNARLLCLRYLYRLISRNIRDDNWHAFRADTAHLKVSKYSQLIEHYSNGGKEEINNNADVWWVRDLDQRIFIW